MRVEPAAATPSSGVAHIAGGLDGDGIGCPAGHPNCSVDVSMLGSDVQFDIRAGRLSVTGIGITAGHGLTPRGG